MKQVKHIESNLPVKKVTNGLDSSRIHLFIVIIWMGWEVLMAEENGPDRYILHQKQKVLSNPVI